MKIKNNISYVYKAYVYVNNSGNVVIIKNPTICSISWKSSYQPKVKESEEMVDADTIGESNEV